MYGLGGFLDEEDGAKSENMVQTRTITETMIKWEEVFASYSHPANAETVFCSVKKLKVN